jgi:hypothetical protein
MKPLLLSLLLVSMVGCFKPEPQPNMPLSGRGVITSNNDGHVWLDFEDSQMVEYDLCDDSPNLAGVGEGVDITFKWNSKDKCYIEKDAYHLKELDKK